MATLLERLVIAVCSAASLSMTVPAHKEYEISPSCRAECVAKVRVKGAYTPLGDDIAVRLQVWEECYRNVGNPYLLIQTLHNDRMVVAYASDRCTEEEARRRAGL